MSEVLHKGDEVVLMNGQMGVIEDFFFVKRNQYVVISLGKDIFIQQVKKIYSCGYKKQITNTTIHRSNR